MARSIAFAAALFLSLTAVLASIVQAQAPALAVSATDRYEEEGILDLTVSAGGNLAQDGWLVTLSGTVEVPSTPYDFNIVLENVDGTMSNHASWSTSVSYDGTTALAATFLVDAIPLTAQQSAFRLTFSSADSTANPYFFAQFDIVAKRIPTLPLFDMQVNLVPFFCCDEVVLPGDGVLGPTLGADDLDPYDGSDPGDGDPFHVDFNQQSTADATTSTTTLTGQILFPEEDGSGNFPCRWCFVEVWDDDCCGNADDFLGTMLTDYNGYFTFSGLNNDDVWSGQDIFFKIVLDSGAADAKVVNAAGTVYQVTTGVLYTDCGSPCNMGSKIISIDGELRRAFWINDAIAKSANMVRNHAGAANFDPDKVTVRYPADTYTGHTHGGSTAAHYHAVTSTSSGDAAKEIFFYAKHGANQMVPSHEYGHFVMNNRFGFTTFPSSTNCANHNAYTTTDQACAWREGWADYWALATHNTATMYYTGGGTIDFECDPIANCNWPAGDATEGRIIATLWDIFDNTPTESTGGWPADSVDLAFANTWAPLNYGAVNSSPDLNFPQYFGSWTPSGQSYANFDNAGDRNTIHY